MTSAEQRPDVPSLDVIREELDKDRATQEKRAESSDSRAVAIVAASLVASTFLINTKSLLALLGIACAVVAAGYGVLALWPRPRTTVNLRALRNRYLAAPEEVTKGTLLDQRLADFDFNEEQVRNKTRRVKRAMAWLLAAVFFIMTTAAIRLVTDSTNSEPAAPRSTTVRTP